MIALCRELVCDRTLGEELFAITLCRELAYGCVLEKKLVCDRTSGKDLYTIAL
jgi:hypothetical protein